ncbi:hypothetical protein ACIA5G_35690 [Amycolatopsis sp. NPDC051758]|uniref:hypothetical protein n=1 Tax=Amycolatopsis sp. NPDC051758 TaxID=3363935 RepID=UPI0037B1D6C7
MPRRVRATPLDLNSGSVAARKLGASNAQLTAGDPEQTFENRMRIELSGTIGSRKVSGELSVKRETDGNYCVSGVIAPS